MFIDMTKRTYRLKKRAESQEATRARIVEALMQLHEELGPRNATIRAIAERAGVQRLTVYRHFPDDGELFQACTSRWLELNPPPDPRSWNHLENGMERCRAALEALYAYYRGTRRMLTVSFRDEPEVPALRGPMRAFREYLGSISAGLTAALPEHAVSRPGVAETVAHATEFPSWASLADQGLDDSEAAAVAVAWIEGAMARGAAGVGAEADRRAMRPDRVRNPG